MRIGIRLLLGVFLVLAITALVVLRVFVEEVKPGTRQAMEDTLLDAAYAFAALATDDMKAGRMADGAFAQAWQRLPEQGPDANIWGFRKQAVDYRVSITNDQGVVVFDSAGEWTGRDHSRWNDVYLTLRGQYGARSTLADPNDETSSVMHVAAPIRDGDRIVGVLTVSKPTATLLPYIERSQQRILAWSGWLLGLTLLLGLLLSWWLASSVSRLKRYAQAVAQGQRVELPQLGRISGRTELNDLAQAIEAMRQKLEGKAYVEQYVHSLTHELKSPLSAIQGASELLAEDLPAADRARFSNNSLQQVHRLRVLVDKLLALASVEHLQQAPDVQPLDWATLSRDTIANGPLQLEAAGITVHWQGPEHAWVRADRFLLGQAMVNLLENAHAFAPEGSTIEVSLQQQDQHWVWRVRDHGPGVPDYALDRLFERFYSLPGPRRPGKSSGLGLCLVREVMTLHGGRVTVANVREGQQVLGCEACLILPFDGH
jgi:two-component system sensor histidine kinase CreC